MAWPLNGRTLCGHLQQVIKILPAEFMFIREAIYIYTCVQNFLVHLRIAEFFVLFNMSFNPIYIISVTWILSILFEYAVSFTIMVILEKSSKTSAACTVLVQYLG
jgi:hypothetical protein